MATEQDRRDERDRLGSDPMHAPPEEQLEEENPVESPATDEEGERVPHRDSPEERASTTMEPSGRIAKSTEGQTVAGTEKTPDGPPR